MWPSSTNCEADESIDESQSSGGTITSSIGVIGRKNLRADAPVFKASNSDLSSMSYDAGIEKNASDNGDYYGQETASEYLQMNRSSMEQCRISPESMGPKGQLPSPSQHMFFSHEDRADYNAGCSTGYPPNNRYLTQNPSPRNAGRMIMLHTPIPSPLTITQPPYNYNSPQHQQQSRGMNMQEMSNHSNHTQGDVLPRSPSHSMVASGVSVFSPIAMSLYNKQQLQQPQGQQQSLSLSPMNKFSREQQRLAQPLISADGYIYQVHFKRAHRNFLLSPSAPRNILPGDFVKVEADRGEDLGVVVSKSLVEDFVEFVPTAGYRGRGYSAGLGEKKYIIRFATAEERMLLRNKVEDEERTLQVIREKVIERRLPMAILDAEYQFDHHKLVYFFEADRRIDFRELVSDLFSLYKTRIWMQQVDTSTIPGEEVGLRLAHAAGFLPSSYMNEGGESMRNIDELTQTVSDFAAVQVFQADEELNLSQRRSISVGNERDRDAYRDSYPASAVASPSQSRVDRMFMASPLDQSQNDRLRVPNSNSERDRDVDLMGELPSSQSQKNQKKPFMSPLGAFPFPPSATSSNEEIDTQRGTGEEKTSKGADFGGSMGPLLNGAWAYEH